MKHLIRLAAILLISAPVLTSAATVAELQAQAQALLQQVASLQVQLGQTSGAVTTQTGGTLTPTVSVNSTACPQLGVTLRYGSSGEDVTRLQQFLARDPSIYPEGQVTGYFGGLTQAAVQRWQVKFNIVSSGSPETTGYGQVGPRTAAAMSLQCSTGSIGGTGANTGATVGGFIQVSPISGQAPLSVGVTANVNTVASCAAATYTLSWGDGTIVQSIPVPAGACAQLTQTYKHLYLYGGTYVITLAAGNHQSTATVVVSGPGGPITTGPTLPAESITASTLSGQAPLSVTFNGTVTGADQGWCAGSCSDTMDYGDGSTGQVTLPAASNGVQNFSLQHTYTTAGTFTAKLYQGTAAAGHALVGSPMTITVTVNTATYSYGPLAVTPNVGGNPLAVTAQFDLPSSCTGYRLVWGDGSPDATQADGGTSCTPGVVTRSFNHSYSGAGSYAILLKRGATLAQEDSVSLVISN